MKKPTTDRQHADLDEQHGSSSLQRKDLIHIRRIWLGRAWQPAPRHVKYLIVNIQRRFLSAVHDQSQTEEEAKKRGTVGRC